MLGLATDELNCSCGLFSCLFFERERERERAHVNGGGAEREEDRGSETSSMLTAQGPMLGSKS